MFWDSDGLDVEILVGGPYDDHPYGHTAIRVFGDGYDNVYDFGRYASVWGFGSSEGEGILQIWNNSFERYIAGENALGRITYGFHFGTTPEQDKKIIDHFNILAKAGEPVEKRSIHGVRSVYRLKADYHALKCNCTTISIDGFKVAEPNFKDDIEDFIRGNGLGWKEKAAAHTVGGGWPENIFMPLDLLNLLDSLTMDLHSGISPNPTWKVENNRMTLTKDDLAKGIKSDIPLVDLEELLKIDERLKSFPKPKFIIIFNPGANK